MTRLKGRAGLAPSAGRSRLDLLCYVLMAAVLCYIWRLQDLFPILASMKIVPIVSLAALGLALLDRDPHRSLLSARHRITICVALILGLMVLSVPGSVYPGLSFDFIVQDFAKTILLMLLLAAGIRSIRDVEFFAVAQLIGAGIYCIFILWRFDIGVGGRLGNLLSSGANALGMLVGCTLPAGVYFLRSGVRSSLRILAIGVILISLMTVVKTGSRGAFLALIAVLLYMLFQFDSFTARTRYTAVAVMALLLLLVADANYWSMMQTLLNPQEDYNWVGGADEGRMEVWKRGIGYMLQRPLFGVGASAFPVAEGTILNLASREEYGIGLKWSAAHNSFVQIGAELGVGGLVIFCVLLGSAFFACHEIGRGDGRRGATAPAALGQAFCASLIGYLVAGFFLSQAYAVYLFATFGIIVGFIKAVPVADPGEPRMVLRKMPRVRTVRRPDRPRRAVPVRGRAGL
jgi:O-antigen ligase